jgi:tetratricopeptide (TPR) repeat protein
MKKYLLMLMLVLFAAPARAITPAELSLQAQKDYEAGRYEQSIQAWQELSEIGFVNGDLFYNIASAYWRLGKVGQARRYFLKALSWSPRDPAIRQNLSFIDSKFGTKTAGDGPLALIRKIPFYRLSLNAPESLVLGAISSAGVFSLWWLYRRRRKPSYLVGALLILPLLGFGIWQLKLHSYWGLGAKTGVVLLPKLALRDSPLPDASWTEELAEGSLVRMKKSQGDFALVKSASGKEGWVERSSLGEIE